MAPCPTQIAPQIGGSSNLITHTLQLVAELQDISALITLKTKQSTDSRVGERQKKRRNMRFEDAKAKMLARF